VKTTPPVAPAAKAQTAPAPVSTTAPRVVLETTMGDITIELNPPKAPITVKNFLRYVDEGFYDGTIFHRVIPTFMIQGGGYTGPTEQKTQGQHEPIQNEAANGLKNLFGTIAMARTGDPHSATSEFFINVADNTGLDYPARDGWGYCVFGEVVDGMDAVEEIKNVRTGPNPVGEMSQPINPPVIRKARRVTN